MNNKEENNLFTSNEGILVGTVFKTLYKPYKGHKQAKLKNLNEQQKMLLKVQEYSLACHDLSLYLDIYPNDTNALKEREIYHKLREEAVKQYNEKYPPFTKNAKEINKIPYPWSTTPFPWGDK